MSGPGLVTVGAGLIGNGIAKGADAIGNSATQSQQNQSTYKSGPADTYPQGVQTTKALVPGAATANEGIGKAAEIEKEIGAPVGEAVKTTGGLEVQKDARQLIDETHKSYSDSVAKANEATIAAEKALHAAVSNAAIDPQQYLNKMGTDQKVMTAIGMALSGIGAGLTGQPNLAVDLYNRNTDRAIAAQQKKFENLMTTSAQSAGLLKTAQDRQMIAANAYNMATISVMSGNNAAIQGAQMQIKSTAAPEVAKQLYYENGLKLQQATDNHNRDYINVNQSGDERKVNLLSAITVPMVDYMKPGTKDRFSLSPASSQQRAGGGGAGPASKYSLSPDNETTPARAATFDPEKLQQEEELATADAEFGFEDRNKDSAKFKDSILGGFLDNFMKKSSK